MHPSFLKQVQEVGQMLTITIGGQAGAGGHEIGAEVSKKLGLPLVRTLAIRKLARRLDASVDAVVRKELAFGSKRIRIANALEYGLGLLESLLPARDGQLGLVESGLCTFELGKLPVRRLAKSGMCWTRGLVQTTGLIEPENRLFCIK